MKQYQKVKRQCVRWSRTLKSVIKQNMAQQRSQWPKHLAIACYPSIHSLPSPHRLFNGGSRGGLRGVKHPPQLLKLNMIIKINPACTYGRSGVVSTINRAELELGYTSLASQLHTWNLSLVPRSRFSAWPGNEASEIYNSLLTFTTPILKYRQGSRVYVPYYADRTVDLLKIRILYTSISTQ